MREAQNIREVEILGIDWIGMIFWSGSKRFVSSQPSYLPKGIKKVGVFVNADLQDIKQHVEEYQLDFIQLHGQETPDFVQALKPSRVIKAFNISDPEDFQQTEDYEGIADYFLFDTKGASIGGNGEKFNWSVLSHYHGETPFILSGGIGPDDASGIKALHHPMFIGIDLNSRFEIEPGIKDITKLDNFVKQLKA